MATSIPNYNILSMSVKDKKTIVGYRFQEDGQSIENSLDEVGITWTNVIAEFKAGTHQVLVLQCARGKAANIQICQNIIYYTADFSL